MTSKSGFVSLHLFTENRKRSSPAWQLALAYDFVEQPPQEFICPVSLDVLVDPYLTACCGNHLSQETYQRLQGKPCPVCREENLTAVLDKSVKRKVLSLAVRCPQKEEGCKWTGELRDLELHLNIDLSTDDYVGKLCRFVDVACPYGCGERVQRRNFKQHRSQQCPLRPSVCRHCKFKATHQEVTKEHWPVCENYPLQCPNGCAGKKMKRQHLKEHLKQTCPYEVIQCEFGYAGCRTRLQRRFMSAHVKEGTEPHLSMLSLVSTGCAKIASSSATTDRRYQSNGRPDQATRRASQACIHEAATRTASCSCGFHCG